MSSARSAKVGRGGEGLKQTTTTMRRGTGSGSDLSKRKVFENDWVEGLVMEYRRGGDFGVFYEVCRHSKNLVDSIIRGSGFSRHVNFHDLCAHVFLQFERWITKWTPGEGTLYSYLSTCVKHCCISLASRESAIRHRQVLLGEIPMESLGASYDHDFGVDPELTDDIRRSITVRWNEPHIREAAAYAVEEVLNGGYKNRRSVLLTMSLTFPELGSHHDAGERDGVEVAKFLLDWAGAAVRLAWLERRVSPITEYDVHRLRRKFSFLPDLVEVVGAPMAAKLIAVFGGMSIRFPSISTWEKSRLIARAFDAWMADPSPVVLEAWASKLKMPPSRLEETLMGWADNMRSGVLEDADLPGDPRN